MPNVKLILSIIDYLKSEAKKETNSDTQESLEVAVQCLETAYDIDSNVSKNTVSITLEDVFNSAFPESADSENAEGHIHKSEMMKNLGNSLMKNSQYSEAIRYYTAAIEINDSNPIYYCNRAAAYSKLNDFNNAIKDCLKAIDMDPTYAKAYGRMGLAFLNLGRYEDAVKAFEKAVNFDPSNESYSANLKLAQDKKLGGAGSAEGASFGGLNRVDWSSLIINPEFRNMASSIMQDPNVINALSFLSSNLANPVNNTNDPFNAGSTTTATTTTTDAPGGQNRNLDVFLEVGQYLASQLQASNPDLLEQFRQNSRSSQNQDNKDPPTQ